MLVPDSWRPPIAIVAEEREMLSDNFFHELVDMCMRLDCRPVDMAGCWMSESGLSPAAHNPGGNASGLFQAMPATLVGLGFQGHWDDFIKLSAEEQLKWAERYYAPHKGRLVSAGACYLATFLPALMAHADEPLFVLCGEHGPFAYAYSGNKGAFDPEGKGYITVQDLTDRIHRVTTGPRWLDIAARIQAAETVADTEPSLPDGIDLGCVEGQQTAFSRLGYECEIDGVWGPQSAGACRSFQGDHPPLTCDGVCGPLTRGALAIALQTAE